MKEALTWCRLDDDGKVVGGVDEEIAARLDLVLKPAVVLCPGSKPGQLIHRPRVRLVTGTDYGTIDLVDLSVGLATHSGAMMAAEALCNRIIAGAVQATKGLLFPRAVFAVNEPSEKISDEEG